MAFTGVFCGQCGLELLEKVGLPTSKRTPCPSCKSLSRQIKAEFHATARGIVGMRATGREPGRKKPFVEIRDEPSKSIKLGRDMRHERTIDRRGDKYKEKVTDPLTSDVLHECDEPLSKHRGHGSGKKPK